MNEKIKEFLQKMAQDDELATKFGACKTPEEAYALATGVVEGFSKEEFVSAMEQVKAALDTSTTLTDEDLSKFAGGDEVSELVSYSVISSVSTAASVSCLAAAI